MRGDEKRAIGREGHAEHQGQRERIAGAEQRFQKAIVLAQYGQEEHRESYHGPREEPVTKGEILTGRGHEPHCGHYAVLDEAPWLHAARILATRILATRILATRILATRILAIGAVGPPPSARRRRRKKCSERDASAKRSRMPAPRRARRGV